MAVSCKRLWHLLLDNNLKKIDSERKAEISHYADLPLSIHRYHGVIGVLLFP